MDKLTGIHAVKEALEARRPIDRIAIAKGRQDTRVEEIVQLARKQGVPVRFEDRGQIDRLANSKDHQGVVALAAARAAATLGDILAIANASPGQKGLIVLLDGDRKSTRLNSSHGYISYAVFCLKKKKISRQIPSLLPLH